MELLKKLTLQVLNDPGSISKSELEQIKLHELCNAVGESFQKLKCFETAETQYAKSYPHPFTDSDKKTVINISAFIVMFLKPHDYSSAIHPLRKDNLMLNPGVLSIIHTPGALWHTIFVILRNANYKGSAPEPTDVKIDLCAFGKPGMRSKSTKLNAAGKEVSRGRIIAKRNQ